MNSRASRFVEVNLLREALLRYEEGCRRELGREEVSQRSTDSVLPEDTEEVVSLRGLIADFEGQKDDYRRQAGVSVAYGVRSRWVTGLLSPTVKFR